jgi:hypothetical protein
MSTSRSPVLTVDEWTPKAFKTLAPKVNDRGGKSIGVISLETNRSMQLSTPMMLTWGISDYLDKETGESDGKFSMSLQFPSDEYRKPATDMFLEKLKEFESRIIDEAVTKSEVWFGEPLSRELVIYNMWAFLKYPRIKDSKRPDMTKAPTLKVKVPYYDTKWGLELYDIEKSRIFPGDNGNLTPLDFVPSKSQIACVIQCTGINIVGKGWGPAFKITQGMVKPRENQSILGKCHVFLSDDDRKTLLAPAAAMQDEEDETPLAPAPAPDTDDDEEEEEEVVKKAVKRPASDVVPAVVKKVVKKKVVAVVP